MNTILYHYKAVITTFEKLTKGKFLLFFIPGLVITLIYWWFLSFTSSIASAVTLASDYSWIDWIYGYINSGVEKVFSLFGLIVEQIYIFFVLTLISPFNTFLGEKLDGELTGIEYKFTFTTFINDLIRMIFIVAIALALEFTFFIGYWMISWIFDDFIDDIVYFVIAAFFFGFAFYDFSLERYKVNISGSLWFAFTNPLTMLITGSIFLLIYKIPLIGIPLAPVLTVMISTIVYLYQTKKLAHPSTEKKEDNNE